MATTARPRTHHRWDTRFVQQESITTCIRNNISEYGGGTICLREMLANADDAGAKHFTVCLDKSTYQQSGLLHANMAKWQGPAVFVHNDALFTNDVAVAATRAKWVTVRSSPMLIRSGKFGKGAMTAYYLSDGIRDNHLLMLDPHQTHLPDHLPSVRGELVHPKDEFYNDIQAQVPGQIQPFTSFAKACPAVFNLQSWIFISGDFVPAGVAYSK